LPIHAIQDRLLEAGIPARLSASAGTFLCNALMYHALRLCAERAPPPCCGFIHLPYLPEQVARLITDDRRTRRDTASMGLEIMVRAVETVITLSRGTTI
jgi:pyroglutamyl-peptidase